MTTLKSRVLPSFGWGYAKNSGESAYPRQWDRLRGAWMPGIQSGGEVLEDLSGRNNPGVLVNGPVWGGGRWSSALVFDGVNDFVEVNTGPELNFVAAAKYTWSFWVRPDSFASFSASWAQQATTGTDDGLFIYTHSEGSPPWGPVTNGVSVGIVSLTSNQDIFVSNNNVLQARKWAHVAATYDGSLARSQRVNIFVNGVNVTNTHNQQNASPGNFTANTARIAGNEVAGERLNGRIDDFRFYHRVLSKSEILLNVSIPYLPFYRKQRRPKFVLAASDNRSYPRGILRGNLRGVA